MLVDFALVLVLGGACSALLNDSYDASRSRHFKRAAKRPRPLDNTFVELPDGMEDGDTISAVIYAYFPDQLSVELAHTKYHGDGHIYLHYKLFRTYAKLNHKLEKHWSAIETRVGLKGPLNGVNYIMFMLEITLRKKTFTISSNFLNSTISNDVARTPEYRKKYPLRYMKLNSHGMIAANYKRTNGEIIPLMRVYGSEVPVALNPSIITIIVRNLLPNFVFPSKHNFYMWHERRMISWREFFCACIFNYPMDSDQTINITFGSYPYVVDDQINSVFVYRVSPKRRTFIPGFIRDGVVRNFDEIEIFKKNDYRTMKYTCIRARRPRIFFRRTKHDVFFNGYAEEEMRGEFEDYDVSGDLGYHLIVEAPRGSTIYAKLGVQGHGMDITLRSRQKLPRQTVPSELQKYEWWCADEIARVVRTTYYTMDKDGNIDLVI